MTRATELILAADLKKRLGDPNLRVIDASWYLPDMKRDAAQEFAAAHIPGAVFFDIDEHRDRASSLPHMMPSAAELAQVFGQLGITDRHQIVVYDGAGLFSAARVWWMLKRLGHADVRVLDGGFPAWIGGDFPTETGPNKAIPAIYQPAKPRTGLADGDTVAKALDAGNLVLDARPVARFRGEAPEPRPGVRAGHMPGAVSLFYKDLLTAEGQLLPDDALRNALAARGHVPGRPTIASCGSGVTAAIIMLALAVLGDEAALFDGSWAEWGSDPQRPVVTGDCSSLPLH